MNRKLVTIDIEGQSNVGVIDLGDLRDVHQDKFPAYLIENVEDRLVKALEEHFNDDVKIHGIANIKTLHPITIEYVVFVGADDENYKEIITLNETWIY